MFENMSRGVQRYVESRDAGISGGEMSVVRWSYGHRRHGLETFFGRWKRWGPGPEIYL